jgi:hypothetical protein
MRCVAGAGLLALVGCNQILGITPTTPYDAGPDVVPDRPHVVLDWQIAGVLPSSGAPDPTIVYTPIDPPPAVRIATLDGPFDQVVATYTPVDGSIAIPSDYQGITWRLEYTLAGDIPHEVQWAPEDKKGHLTVPVFGRLRRDPVPLGSGYTITPPSLPGGGYTFPRVFTTGLWTEGTVSPKPTGATADYDFRNSASFLSGTNGRPEPGLGDRGFLVDYVVNGTTSCRIAVGSAAIDPALQANQHTVQAPVWDAAVKAFTSAPIDSGTIARFGDGLGLLDGGMGYTGSLLFGMAASTAMPGLTATSTSLLLPVPVMVTLLQCPYFQVPPMTAQPAMLDLFPHVVHVQIVNTRPVAGLGGLTLTSGFETVVTSTDGSFAPSFPAAIPTQMKLTTPTRGTVDLSGPDERVVIGPNSGSFTLDFLPEASLPGKAVRADYHDVVLHRIAGGVLIPERIYTVTAPRVRIDGAQLAPGADYVLEIRSYKGHLQAPQGDFTAVDFPYGAAIVFTRTFKTS